MKIKRILTVLMLSAAALVFTSLLVATPASASGLPTNRVFDDTPDSVLTDTWPTTHPVGIVLATFFNIPYTQVMALHDEGFGFGNIARAYLTAYASGGVLTPTEVLQMRQEGMGWGKIKNLYGIHPGGNGLGSIMRNKGAAPVITTTVTPDEPEAGPPSRPESGQGSSVGSNCPGNSCNAPGHQKNGSGDQNSPGHQNQPKGKPTKVPKSK